MQRGIRNLLLSKIYPEQPHKYSYGYVNFKQHGNLHKTRNKPEPVAQTLGTVRFQGLVEHLRQQISSGVLLTGDRLPSFVELQGQFGTSPGTVNRALISLEQEGLVVRVSGDEITNSLARRAKW